MKNVRKGLALIIGAAALMKLSGHSSMQDKFEEWGYPDELRQAVGLAEATAATLLWIDRGRPVSRAVVSAVMLGAVVTHLKTSGERLQSLLPLAILATTNIALDL